MSLREAAQKALEALEWVNRYGSDEHGPSTFGAEHVLREALAEPERRPLTDEEIDALWNQHRASPNWLVDLTRAVERAHGIGGEA
jgi:hypothetical protein